MPRKPQPNAPYYGLEVVQLYPYYSTREAAQAAGERLNPYDDTKPPKYWRLPSSEVLGLEPEESVQGLFAAYSARGAIVFDGQGNPRPVSLNVTAETAVAYNIPPKGVGIFPGTARSSEIQPPIFLLDNERLEQQPGIAAAQLRVRRVDVAMGPSLGAYGDRELLEAIALKVGVQGK